METTADLLRTLGSWLANGSAPWWAAIVTFFLGQLYSLKGAREQRAADSADREKEREHALDIVSAERQTNRERLEAERTSTLQVEDMRLKREAHSRAKDEFYRGRSRVIAAIASLRTTISLPETNDTFDANVVVEFHVSSSEFDGTSHWAIRIRDEVHKFFARGPDNPPSRPEIEALIRALAEYEASVLNTGYWEEPE